MGDMNESNQPQALEIPAARCARRFLYDLTCRFRLLKQCTFGGGLLGSVGRRNIIILDQLRFHHIRVVVVTVSFNRHSYLLSRVQLNNI